MKVEAFTDGSCKGNPGPGGWAAVLTYGEHRKVISGELEMTTNNQAELVAIKEALTAIKKPVELHVYTDSKLAHDWLSGASKRRNPAINALCEDIEKLAEQKGVQLKLHKVPGHAGHPQNELAHEAASKAAEAAKAKALAAA